MTDPSRLAATATLAILTILPAQDDSRGERPRRALSAAAVAVLRAASGRHPFEDLAAWARDPDDAALWLHDCPDELTAASREALVCALWSEDADTAFGAACHVPESRLDLRDIERWFDVVWPHAFDERGRYDWDTFKHVLDVDQVGRLLDGRPVWEADVRGHFIADLHRSLRPVHVPALCQLVHHDDPIVRSQSFYNLALLSIYTDRYRENIATEILKWPGMQSFEIVDYDDPSANPVYEPRAFELPPETGGYSPLLHATLERWFVDLEHGERTPHFDTWLMRWADAERPGPRDRKLLRALLDSTQRHGRWIALRAMRRFPGDQIFERRLGELAADAEPYERALAIAATGDARRLRELARTDPTALAIALELDLDGMWPGWVGRAFGGNTAAGLAAIEQLENARDLSRWVRSGSPLQ